MKPDRLALMTRLARLRDEEAGRTVQQWRAALDTSQRQADMLRQYRRNLSAAQLTGRQAEGRTLHTFAEFAAVAERAHRQAYETVKSTQQQYDQALQDWYDKRRKTQVLTDKQAREEKQRQREQCDREDRASQEADAANRR